jgi:hypothetical protein
MASPYSIIWFMKKQDRWTGVRVSMATGALYDFLFAVAILLLPVKAAGLLDLQLPDNPVYLNLNGIFLMILAGVYVLPVLEPHRYRGVVYVAVAGRFLGFLYLGSVWWAGAPESFLFLALGDLTFALLHAVLLWRAVSFEMQPEETKGA